MQTLTEQIHDYLASAWRYRWVGVAVAWLIGVVGWTALTFIPDRYQAAARVYVDTQSILRPLLAGLAMQPNVTQIVEMMSKTLISRPNVEKLVKMANLEPKEISSPLAHELLVNRLTRELSVKGTGAQNFYTIAYFDDDPARAKRVVQSLLTIFEQGLEDNRKDSDSARTFIEDQLKVYADRLVAAEAAIIEFKRRNIGLMPGQGENFFTRITEARKAVSQARLELAEAEQAREAIKRRFATEPLPSLLEERTDADGSPEPEFINPDLDARITTLQQKLDTLRLSYTERHPDIVALLPAIEKLKAQRQREIDEKRQREAAKPRKSLASPTTKGGDPVQSQLTISMAEYDANVASLRARVAEYERRLSELKAAANAVPQVEAEYTQLTRDYEVTKRNYEQLASRRETAQLTGDVQSSSNVMEFRVIDPPQVNTRPDWPNRPLMKTAVLLLALGAGIAIAFVIGQLRPTIDNESSLKEVSGLAVFGTVPLALSGANQRGKRLAMIAMFACVLGILIAYLAVMFPPMTAGFGDINNVLGR